MVGNIKFALIIIASFIIFGEQIKYEQIPAMTLVLLGKYRILSQKQTRFESYAIEFLFLSRTI